MGIINQVITILENGNWFTFEELTNNYYFTSPSQIIAVLDFLIEYDLLEKNYNTGKFRLVPKFVSLMKLK
ncbi:MAG: hypothetical protein P8Y18_08190 [Candidatus Bathyarchaeota archaeon]